MRARTLCSVEGGGLTRAKRFLTGVLFVGLAAGLSLPTAAETIALVGGTVHTVSGEVIPQGTVVMSGGKIISVRAGTDHPVDDVSVVDVTGLHVYPGMISAGTALGLVEVNSVKGTRDETETGNLNPNLRAKVAINPDSELIAVTRANGVLTVLTYMGGGLITGNSVVWNLDGWTWEDWTVKDDAALHINWPSMVKASGWRNRKSDEEQKKEREEKLGELTDMFDEARVYMKAREGNSALHPEDVRWEAMIPALNGDQKVIVHADEYQQIESALDFAAEQELDIVIFGGRDAAKLGERLAAQRVPVILHRVLNVPRRSWEAYDATYTVAAELHEAGVQFCITYGGGSFTAANTRNLPYHAAMAAAFGLPREEALKAVTLYPAQILGVADRLGSIEEGKDANLIVTTGDPLEITSEVTYAFIGGNPVDLSSRHTRLYDKYRNRPRTDDGESHLVPAAGTER